MPPPPLTQSTNLHVLAELAGLIRLAVGVLAGVTKVGRQLERLVGLLAMHRELVPRDLVLLRDGVNVVRLRGFIAADMLSILSNIWKQNLYIYVYIVYRESRDIHFLYKSIYRFALIFRFMFFIAEIL